MELNHLLLSVIIAILSFLNGWLLGRIHEMRKALKKP